MGFYLLYNLLICGLTIALFPLWIGWMLAVPKVRAGFFEKLGCLSLSFRQQLENLPLENRVWLHAVSVGELNAAKPLIGKLQEKGYPVILSTTTATGNALARKSYPELPVFYFPLDFPWIVCSILRRIRPALLVILETEIWPNLLFHAHWRSIPVIMANGRLSQKSFRGYSRFRGFFRWVLSHYSRLVMQSTLDAERMIDLGVDHGKIVLGGNLKFDCTLPEKQPCHRELEILLQLSEESKLLLFASTHKGEDEIFIEIFSNLVPDFPNLRAVLAPRHPERASSITLMLMEQGVLFALRSHLTPANPIQAPVILLDTIGELNALFSFGTLACMGGTFIEWGGHNPLEPINAQIPVIFGPSMGNFKEIAEKILEAEAGLQAQTPQEAEQQIRMLLAQPERYRQMVLNGQQLLAQNRGATERLMDEIMASLQPQAAAESPSS